MIALKGFGLDRRRIYRATPRFRETVEDIQADRVIVRQTGPKEFIIVVNHPTADVEFVLATTRAPNEPRISTIFGFACGIAVKTSGLTLAEFDLLDAPGEEAGD